MLRSLVGSEMCIRDSFSVHSAGGMHRLMHPFSIAEFTPHTEKKSGNGGGIATFYIKSMGNSTLTGTWFAHALEQQNKKSGGDDASSPSAIVMGPYGSLTVPLESCGHIVLAAGGIGITPMLSTLQYIANQVNTAPKSDEHVDLKLLPRLKSVTLIWSVRDQEVYDLIAPRLEHHANRIRSRQRGITVDLQMYVTRSKAAAPKAGVLEVPNPVDVPATTTTTTAAATEMTDIHHQEDVDETTTAAVNEANADDDNSPSPAAAASDASASAPPPAKTGRPNVAALLGNVASMTVPASACSMGRVTDADEEEKKKKSQEEQEQQFPVGLYLCGPPAFISSTSDIGSKLGMLVHSEIFEF
eukprot:TRINITY_DN12455_c0_g1_i4.p1 TRINITY_DN12455_c0_g1~~TRINITY_DN12455_c0_g1_i4.p1  ORF type:complete len:357 (+),score=85.38 TRINITY_DN12455_c0_g1_i4:143-1213(+)